MNEEKWKQVKDLFHQAQAFPVEDRVEFLDKACAGDTVVREKVDDLLGSYESGFLADPILHEVVEIVGAENNFQEGQVIGRYRLKELIGIGGMGEVYRADDTELNRPVAFKVLHEEVAGDKERVRRFIQEARAASALNHPNILTIHEIGSFQGARFIVSEYVNGETLRERMRGGLTSAESLDIMCQVATALQAAHSAGIVHRDIKPENIMLRQDGLVKILDFGLAKLTEADDLPIDPASPTVSRLQTSPGLIMGTVAYMSPEQARGQAVDSRTDLWSLGVVFHEMLTGESPFKGESVTDLVTSIIKHDPASLNLRSISEELKPICTKALAKDKQSRYQSATDLLQDLQGERKKMEYAIHTDRFISVSSTDELKTQLIRRRPTLSAEYIVTSVKRHKLATLASLAAVLFLGVGLSVYKYNGAPQPADLNGAFAAVIGPSTTEADLKISRFSSPGRMAQIAISPDGIYIAYITKDGGGKNGLRLRNRETLSDVEVVQAPTAGEFEDIGFSPDSGQIYYRHSFPPYTGNTINRVPLSGGPSTKIIVDAETGGSISPDGKMIAFSREVDRSPGSGGGDDVIVANADGSNERVLVHSPFAGPAWVATDQVPTWSLDGRSLVCWTVVHSPDPNHRLTILSIADGSMQLRDEKWWDVTGSVFMPNGSLVIAGKPMEAEKLGPSQLWLIDQNSPPKSITSDLIGYSNLSATRKGDVLVTIQNRSLIDLWSIVGKDASTATPITTSGELVGGGGWNWTPDGRILFTSSVSGNSDIWIMDADGGNRRQLTHDHGIKRVAFMTPDGRYIVFTNSANGWDPHLFRMDADGTNVKQLTPSGIGTASERIPRMSGDGKWVYYTQLFKEYPGKETPPNELRKIPIAGGDPVVLATNAGYVMDVSPKDGLIAFDDQTPPVKQGIRRVKVMSPSTGSIVKTLEFPQATAVGQMKWSPGGRYLTFVDQTKPFHVIRAMSLNGKILSKPLVIFQGQIGLFEWTKDGKQLGYARGTQTTDAVLITKKDN